MKLASRKIRKQLTLSNLDVIEAVLLHFSSPRLLELEGEILVVIQLVERTSFRVLEFDWSQDRRRGDPWRK